MLDIDKLEQSALAGYPIHPSAVLELIERLKAAEHDLNLLKPNPLCDVGCMLSCSMEGKARLEAAERKVAAQAAVIEKLTDAIENHGGNYKLTKAECEELEKIMSMAEATNSKQILAEWLDKVLREPIGYADALDLAKDGNADSFIVKHSSEWHEGLRFKIQLFKKPEIK